MRALTDPAPAPASASALVLVLATLVAGCVSLEKSYPEKTYYLLAAERKAAKRAPVPKAVLRVSSCRVAPAFDKTQIVIRRGESAYEADFWNAFFLPPSEMLTATVRDFYAESGLFENVVHAGSLVDASLVLETAVPAIYADLREEGGAGASAVVSFQALLLRDGADGPKVLLERSYREATPLEDRSAKGIVAGLNAGLAKVLAALEADMAKLDLKAAVASETAR